MDATATADARRHDSPLHVVLATPAGAVRTLTVTADYHLSEAGRKASLLAGGDGRTEQRVTLTLPVTRLHLVHVDGSGRAQLKLRPQFKVNADQRVLKVKFAPVYDEPPTVDRLLEDAARNHELERAYHAQRSVAESAARDRLDDWRTQVALEFLADPARRALAWPAPTTRRCQVQTDRGLVHFDAKRDKGPAGSVPLEAFRRFEADVRTRHVRGAELRAGFDATHAQRLDAMRAWVAEHGSDDQRQRLAAGVLPFAEFLEAFSDQHFAGIDFLERYRLDGASRLQAHLRDYGGIRDAVVAPAELRVQTRLLSTATSTQWPLLQRVQAALPDAHVQLRERSLAWTRDLAAPKLRLPTVLVTMRVGPLSLRREFHLPHAAPLAPARTEEDQLMQA